MLYEQNKIKHRDTRNHGTRVIRNILNKAGEQGDVAAMMILVEYYTEKSKKHARRDEDFSAYFSLQDAKKWLDKLQGKDETKASDGVLEQKLCL